MFVTSFWFSRTIRDSSSSELNYTEVLHSRVYGLYFDKTKLFLISWAEFSRPHGAWLLTSISSHHHKATSTRTSKNNIQWCEILPSSDKKITPLKSSFSLGYNLRKRIVLILLTAVDLIRRSTHKYYACYVTRQCLFRIHFFALQSLSYCPTYLYNYIYLLLSSVFVQMQLVRRSLSLSIKIIYNQVLRDKKKEPAVFWSANFPRLRRQFKYILNNFRLSKLEETMKKKYKPKRNSCVDQKSAEIKLKATLPEGPFHWIRTQEFDQFSVFIWRHRNSN